MIVGIAEIQIAAFTGRTELPDLLHDLLDLQTARRVAQIADIGLHIDGRLRAVDNQHLRLGCSPCAGQQQAHQEQQAREPAGTHGQRPHGQCPQGRSPRRQTGEYKSHRKLIPHTQRPIAIGLQ
ncbi:hypothetical protein D3C71_1810290 [compost metagenome]